MSPGGDRRSGKRRKGNVKKEKEIRWRKGHEDRGKVFTILSIQSREAGVSRRPGNI